MAKSSVKLTGLPDGLSSNFHHGVKTLPPIGVFWDIENCQVPKGKSAMATAHLIRKKFFDGYREAEFMCVCDINKENKDVIQELNNAQVTVVHINATGKNAADDKLRQSMRRFADIHGSPAAIILISGDVNFAADLSDFHHRRHIRVLVIHNNYAPEPLLACAHAHFNFSKLTAEVPFRTPVKSAVPPQNYELLVTKLPSDYKTSQIRSRLKQLSDNCGGKVISVSQTAAVIRFSTPELAQRARIRMSKEDVFGSKISVNFPSKHALQDSDDLLNSPAKRMLYWPYENGREMSPVNSVTPKGTREMSPTSPAKRSRKTVFPPPPTTSQLNAIRKKAVWNGSNGESEMNSTPVFRAGNDCQTALQQLLSRFNGSKDSPTFTWQSFPFVGQERNLRDQRSRKCSTDTPSPLMCLTLPATRNREPVSAGLENEFAIVSSSESSNAQQGCLSAAQTKTGRWPRRRIKSAGQAGNDSANSSSPYQSRSNSREMKSTACTQTCQSVPVAKLGPVNLVASRGSSPVINKDAFFEPIASNGPLLGDQPVELLVTNLDQSIDVNEMRKLLFTIFQQHVMVLHVAVLANPEGNLTALVRVPSVQDAQYAISQLHRRKIGFKRIIISIVSNNGPSLHILKSEVQTLLQDVPSHSLPLFKFRELFEKRYHQTISMSDLHKMKDLVYMQEDSLGRTVTLNPNYRETPSPASSEGSKEVQAIMEKSFCELHCPNPNDGKGWAEKESSKSLPDVRESLKVLSSRVHTLLQSHNGSLPLGSFPACYENEFGPIVAVSVCGVPLEHLIASVPGILIQLSATGCKRIKWAENKNGEPSAEFRTISPPLAPQLTLISREVVDLLKSCPNCMLAFVKFIPAYHHHFGRQCRVADYGFTKLIDLFDAISHVVQVMGEGNKRLLTLTHRSQVKRFTSDLLRLLKSQASKQISLSEFAPLYSKCFGKEFSVTNYGLCDLNDLFDELPENSILITETESDTIISIPKRDQTAAEIERTKVFSREVVQLLRHSSQCRMSFNKFIPAYHHHFGQQCRVSDYGFTKLVELFEAIPDILQVAGEGDEKTLVLQEQELLKVLKDQITTLIKSTPTTSIPVKRLMRKYTEHFGHNINLDDFQVCDEMDLLSKIRHAVKVIDTKEGCLAILVDRNEFCQMCMNVRRLLMDQEDGKMTVEQFTQEYAELYDHPCNIFQIASELEEYIKIDNGIISLLPSQLFARNVHLLLHENNGRIVLSKFESSYLQRFCTPCNPNDFGFVSLIAALHSISDIAQLRGKGHKRTLHLNKDFLAVSPLPSKAKKIEILSRNMEKCDHVEDKPEEREPTIDVQSVSIDLLSEPVPSGVPSPLLRPLPSEEVDLMNFESPSRNNDCAADGRFPSKPRAVMQESLATVLLRNLTLNSPVVPGAPNIASAPSCHQPRTLLTSGARQQLSRSRLDISLPNGNTNLVIRGPSRCENSSSKSCENLAGGDESCFSSSEMNCISSQSTPTHQSVSKTRFRSRIAAKFSHPPNCDK